MNNKKNVFFKNKMRLFFLLLYGCGFFCYGILVDSSGGYKRDPSFQERVSLADDIANAKSFQQDKNDNRSGTSLSNIYYLYRAAQLIDKDNYSKRERRKKKAKSKSEIRVADVSKRVKSFTLVKSKSDDIIGDIVYVDVKNNKISVVRFYKNGTLKKEVFSGVPDVTRITFKYQYENSSFNKSRFASFDKQLLSGKRASFAKFVFFYDPSFYLERSFFKRIDSTNFHIDDDIHFNFNNNRMLDRFFMFVPAKFVQLGAPQSKIFLSAFKGDNIKQDLIFRLSKNLVRIERVYMNGVVDKRVIKDGGVGKGRLVLYFSDNSPIEYNFADYLDMGKQFKIIVKYSEGRVEKEVHYLSAAQKQQLDSSKYQNLRRNAQQTPSNRASYFDLNYYFDLGSKIFSYFLN